jgi:hypothetical protein
MFFFVKVMASLMGANDSSFCSIGLKYTYNGMAHGMCYVVWRFQGG